MSEYEYVIIIILSSGSVWPVVHNLMVRTLEANKKVDECTCQQRHKALFCVSNTYCRLWLPLYWIQKSQKVLKTVKSYQLLFFYSKRMKNCLHNMASYVTLCHQNVFLEVAYCSLKNHFLSNKNKTRTHTNLCDPAVSLCSGFQLFEHRKKIYQGELDALSLFKKNSRSSFFSDVFSQDFHLKHVAWSAILCPFSLSNLQEL